MTFNAEEILARLDAVEKTDVEDNEQVRRILTNAKARFKTIDVLGEKVKIRSLIDRNIRHYLEEKSKVTDGNLDQTEMSMYEVISKMCIESPFNKPEVWEYLDTVSGVAPDAMKAIFEINESEEKKIKKFQ
jgi:NAD(P)-dependent dehydrogenase (short-subunit alcohol dehydrogenase family)